jgi:hypothetical protein
MESSDWFYNVGDHVHGPMSPAELKWKATSGEILPDTPVRKGADGVWVRAVIVQGLFQRSDSAPTSSPAAVTAKKETRPPSSPPPLSPNSPSVLTGSTTKMKVSPLAMGLAAGGILVVALFAVIFLSNHRGKDVASVPKQQPSEKVWTPDTASIPAWLAGSTPVEAPWKPPADAKLVKPLSPQPPPGFTKGQATRQNDTHPAPSIDRETEQQGKFTSVELYRHVSPSVVSIYNYDSHDKIVATGSGFLVSRDGHVVTNLHVIQGAHKVKVRLHNGNIIPVGDVVGFDNANDLAVLDVDGSEYKYLQLSAESAAVGTQVYAIGDPMGLSATMSGGIIEIVPLTVENCRAAPRTIITQFSGSRQALFQE